MCKVLCGTLFVVVPPPPVPVPPKVQNEGCSDFVGTPGKKRLDSCCLNDATENFHKRTENVLTEGTQCSSAADVKWTWPNHAAILLGTSGSRSCDPLP